MNEIEAKAKQIVMDKLGADEAALTPEADFQRDLNADSLDLVELIMAFEKEFGIKIPDEDAEKLRSFGDALNYIAKAKGL